MGEAETAAGNGGDFPDLRPLFADGKPAPRGTLTVNAPLADLTWFRVGGPAQLLFQPADADALADFLARRPASLPVTVIGLGSNLIVRDGGVPGVVIRLGRGFTEVAVEGTRVTAGAGVPDVKVARAAADAGVAGFSFLRGIPGAIGGALRMNGGAYGGEVKDVLVRADGVTFAGETVSYTNAGMDFTYRHCGVPEDVIFTRAVFEGRPGDPAEIAAEMAKVTESREATQPIKSRTGGSTFKNPPGLSAWKLVDAAGCRGLTIGRAQVSQLHTNFLINLGGATAAEIEGLGEEVRRRVKAHSGIELEWEIKRIGLPRGLPGAHDVAGH
ncbi:UDP-N-acetylmuramate dehydrogenase [Xanthobacter dioxanivorans]|uniref:UDP-N-acetylenolpyruvoylglucosamine reductase n=1 Tax=Xanthobacter dioxanivorans TaxID=2528964 RepID=A0A974PRI0_9HYPH|nr:UDP-N-acetylmuramate dehydrogenase [Xanthobacter dioxanivorans]QRG08013.1 UDP-N-acetylmuramate dehydrogenase [Xanthobacter dioxanivorans]